MSKQIRTLLIAGVAVLVLVALLLGLLFLQRHVDHPA